MTLPRRLFLFGAVVPTAFFAIGLLAIGLLLARQLRDATDRALVSQAAIEAVSVFDRHDGTPDLHLERRPLPNAMSGFEPHAALYDRSGAIVVVSDPHRLAPTRVAPSAVGRDLAPATRVIEGRRVRETRMLVDSPHDGTYTLWVGVSLESEDRTLSLYAQAAATVLVVASLLFVYLQRRLSRTLTDRLDRLARHANGLRSGQFSTPERDDGGDVVSELRDAIADATARLRSSEDAEKRLVADAAHELRTPLTAMRAVIDTTLRRERSSDELREALTTLRSEVDRLATLATELLDLAVLRQAEKSREPTDVTVAVRAAVESLRPLADERGIALAVDATDGELVRALPDQVRRAVENLITNALRFASRDSTVRVGIVRTEARVQIRVEDDGEGVAAEDREAIFEPFRRGAGASGRGAGLGLAIVRDVARRHGGEAWVESSESGGTRFVLALGAAKETP